MNFAHFRLGWDVVVGILVVLSVAALRGDTPGGEGLVTHLHVPGRSGQVP